MASEIAAPLEAVHVQAKKEQRKVCWIAGRADRSFSARLADPRDKDSLFRALLVGVCSPGLSV
jgi:hypothetical protein